MVSEGAGMQPPMRNPDIGFGALTIVREAASPAPPDTTVSLVPREREKTDRGEDGDHLPKHGCLRKLERFEWRR